ncbi:MAG: hypothetical protein ACREF1_02745, partial [Acetobacteraceae bacterium]
ARRVTILFHVTAVAVTIDRHSVRRRDLGPAFNNERGQLPLPASLVSSHFVNCRILTAASSPPP